MKLNKHKNKQFKYKYIVYDYPAKTNKIWTHSHQQFKQQSSDIFTLLAWWTGKVQYCIICFFSQIKKNL